MANKQRRAGLISIKVNGEVFDAVGNFDYQPGGRKREAIVGADRVHGFKESVVVPYLEGQITDRRELSLRTLFDLADASVTFELANGKTFLLTGAWFCNTGKVSTETGAVDVRFEGVYGEEVG